MTDEPDIATEISEAKIEQMVKAYLVWNPLTKHWTIDPLMLKGPLDSNYSGIDIDLNQEYWTPALRAEMALAEKEILPTAEELFLMLWSALPAESTVGTALGKITEAASNWSDELTTYIAKGSEEYGQDDEAQGQRDAAREIDDALALLRG